MEINLTLLSFSDQYQSTHRNAALDAVIVLNFFSQSHDTGWSRFNNNLKSWNVHMHGVTSGLGLSCYACLGCIDLSNKLPDTSLLLKLLSSSTITGLQLKILNGLFRIVGISLLDFY